MNTGTKVIVRNLFARTPARLNYLKTEKTEQSHITEYLQNIALLYPHITFEFTSSEKRVFLYTAVANISERIFAIYGDIFLKQLIPLSFELFGMKIEGFISDPKFHFQNKNKQIIAVNGRLIKSPIVYRALAEGYNRYIPHGTFPAYILNLSVNPTEIDINVHPRKLEIRFAHEQEVYRSFYSGVNSRLEDVTLL
jgi:DNA mismatch repair protein MutL